jgi:5-bromo-4-chloroindolyl phosphate hydrolysis protein
MTQDVTKDDEIIEVRLPLKDYKIMREMIEERQAMNGIKKLLTKLFWIAGGLLSLLGLFEIFRRFGE